MNNKIGASYIFILLMIFGCASSEVISGLMRLQDRELLIHPDEAGLAYPHREKKCVPRTGWTRFFSKTRCYMDQQMDFYDFNDKVTREKLRNAGFSCKSKMRFKY